MPLPLLTIRHIDAVPAVVPMARPIRTAVGSIPVAPLVIIRLETHQGIRGQAYIFAYTPTALAALHRITIDIGAELRDRAVEPLSIMGHWDRRFRLLGRQGLLGMAISGLDMALWDALGRAAGLPVASLLGGAPKPVTAYDSFGLLDPAADGPAIDASLARGFRAIKIKLGDGDLGRDIEALRMVRGLAGPAVLLMADYNQSLDVPEAIRRIRRLEEFDLHWIEEPVRAEDLAGHVAVRAGCNTPVQTGENWWFPEGMAAALAAGACDHAMPDVMKIGGVTGWMQAAALAAVHGMPVSSHIFVETSAHLLAVTPTAHLIEYLDKAGAILAKSLELKDGMITAQGPGLGIEIDDGALARYRA